MISKKEDSFFSWKSHQTIYSRPNFEITCCLYFCTRRLIITCLMLNCFPIYLQNNAELSILVICQRWLLLILFIHRLRYIWVWIRMNMSFQVKLQNDFSDLNCSCPVGLGCGIHRLHFCRGVRPRPNECPRYNIKQSDGEVPVMLDLWGMRSTPSLPLLPGPLWSGMVAPDRALSMS